MAVDIQYFAAYMYVYHDGPGQRIQSIEITTLTEESIVNRISEIVGSGNWTLKFLDAEQRLVAATSHFQDDENQVRTFAARPIATPETMTIRDLATAILAAKDTHCFSSPSRMNLRPGQILPTRPVHPIISMET